MEFIQMKYIKAIQDNVLYTPDAITLRYLFKGEIAHVPDMTAHTLIQLNKAVLVEGLRHVSN